MEALSFERDHICLLYNLWSEGMTPFYFWGLARLIGFKRKEKSERNKNWKIN